MDRKNFFVVEICMTFRNWQQRLIMKIHTLDKRLREVQTTGTSNNIGTKLHFVLTAFTILTFLSTRQKIFVNFTKTSTDFTATLV